MIILAPRLHLPTQPPANTRTHTHTHTHTHTSTFIQSFRFRKSACVIVTYGKMNLGSAMHCMANAIEHRRSFEPFVSKRTNVNGFASAQSIFLRLAASNVSPILDEIVATLQAVIPAAKRKTALLPKRDASAPAKSGATTTASPAAMPVCACATPRSVPVQRTSVDVCMCHGASGETVRKGGQCDDRIHK